MRVLAVTPTYGDQMRPEMRASMEALQLEGIDLTWMVIDEQPYPAPDHRNVLHMYRKARQRALRGRYDVMWTVEHDMVVPPDAAQHLNATPGDVVYGPYIIRFGCHVLSAFAYVNDREMGDSLSLDAVQLQAALKHTVARVSGTGWGCTWIRRRALQAIRFPESYAENPPFDIAFSHMCIRAGLQLYANMRVLCGHVRDDVVLWPLEHIQSVVRSERNWLIDGQVIHQYERQQTAERAPEPPPVTVPVTAQPVRVPWLTALPVRVRARQSIVARIGIESERLAIGQEYEVPACDALHLVRAGYVEVCGAVS